VTGVKRFDVGAVRMSRVPYFDIALDPGVVGLTVEQVRAADAPAWATPEGQVLIGQAVWVIESGGRVVVVDPCGAADEFLRSGPEALLHQDAVLRALAEAGFPAERVDTVVLSHLDGIGMAALVGADGRWEPAFPNARVIVTAAELAWIGASPETSGAGAFAALLERGVVDAGADERQLTDELALELSGGHTPGHAVLRISSGDAGAVLLGHLALSPLHAVADVSPTAHVDPDGALRRLRLILDAAAAGGLLVAGPLWPWPGAGVVGAGREVVPAT